MIIAVFDLDGVLFDVSERIRRCLEEIGCGDCSSPADLPREKKKAFWECFLSAKYMHLDRLNADVAERVKELKQRGMGIVIITGRREDTQKEYTLKQLRENGVPFDAIFFRKPGDYRRDHEYKAEVIKMLLREGHVVVEVWDDSERVVEAVKKLLPDARIVHYGGRHVKHG